MCRYAEGGTQPESSDTTRGMMQRLGRCQWLNQPHRRSGRRAAADMALADGRPPAPWLPARLAKSLVMLKGVLHVPCSEGRHPRIVISCAEKRCLRQQSATNVSTHTSPSTLTGPEPGGVFGGRMGSWPVCWAATGSSHAKQVQRSHAAQRSWGVGTLRRAGDGEGGQPSVARQSQC